MDFVKSFDLLGKEAKQIACIEIDGAPTTSTIGAVGVLGMDTKTGDLYTCTAVSSGAYTWVKLISSDEVDAKIAKAQLGGGEVDLSEYAKKTDLEDYATQTYVQEEIAKIPTADVDLSDYALKTDLEGYAKTTDIPSLDGYAKTTDIPNLTDYATQTYVNEAIAALGTGVQQIVFSISNRTYIVAVDTTWQQFATANSAFSYNETANTVSHKTHGTVRYSDAYGTNGEPVRPEEEISSEVFYIFENLSPGGTPNPTNTSAQIGDEIYSVPIGSTWQYLVDSNLFIKSNGYIKHKTNGLYVWYKNGAQVKATDTIVAGANHYVYVGGNQSTTTYITFTVGEDVHNVSTGTTWAVWADNGCPYNLYDDGGRISLNAIGGEPYIVDSVVEDYVAIEASIKNNGEYFIGTLEDIGGGDSGDTEDKEYVSLKGNVLAEYPGAGVVWGDFIDRLSNASDFRGEQRPGDSTGHTYVYYDGTYGEGYVKYGTNYVSMGDEVKAYDYGLSN